MSGTATSELPGALAPLSSLLGELPERPSPSLDRVLDATATCIARHGLARTSMTDIAREMHVARSTLYKQVDSVPKAAWLLSCREAYRFFDQFTDIVKESAGPQALLRLIAEFIRYVTTHPVMVRLLRDEPTLIGDVMTNDVAGLLDYSVALVTPFLNMAMDSGMIRRVDPKLLAGWIGRMILILIVAPPSGDLDDLLDATLLPVLVPA
jgi:AcrR family transcriptional regulator